MKFEVNYRNFRVICQKCGKTGIIDTVKYVNDETEFFIRYDYGRRGKIFDEPQIDFWLCKECLT